MSEIYIGDGYWRDSDTHIHGCLCPPSQHSLQCQAHQAVERYKQHRERRIVQEAFDMEWWAGFWRGVGVASLALGGLLALAVLVWRVM